MDTMARVGALGEMTTLYIAFALCHLHTLHMLSHKPSK